MNSYLYLKIKDVSEHKIIQKLISVNITVYDIKSNNNNVYIKIDSKDYQKIQKYLKTIKFQKVRFTGIEYLKKSFLRYKFIIIALMLSFLMIVICSNLIVDIKVIHEDSKLVELITSELETYGIKKFSFKKSYKYLQKVKEEIKNKNLDKIDWLEINQSGMRYLIRVEERIINNEQIKDNYCHVYSTKDALVKRIKLYKGEAAVNINDYVKKGDLLLSGDIHLNEEVVENVCASGEVYAEVWYEINIKIPFEYYEIKKTGKTRNNFIINYNGIDYQIFKDRLESYEVKKTLIFDLLGIKIYLKKEEEIIKERRKYTEEEILKKSMKLAQNKVKNKLQDSDRIISQKILQNRVIDSTMDIDIFIVAEEMISSQRHAEKEHTNGL